MSILQFLGLGGANHAKVSQISVHESFERVTGGALTLIDVRQPKEWAQTGRPQGSAGVSLQDPDFTGKILAILGDNKQRPVALSCRSGPRSMQGAHRLAKAGFDNVSNVSGGFLVWSRQGLPIDRGPF